MEIGVSEAAARLDVSVRRVRQLLASGQLSGRKVGDNWVLEESELRRRPAVSRPLSERMAWGLIDELSDRLFGFSDGLSPNERYRLREMADRLKVSDNAVPLLRSWLLRRAERMELSCADDDLDDLAHDVRVVRSGISDQRSGMSAASELEFYVVSADRAGLIADYLLVPSARPNVFVHVSHRRMPKLSPLVVLAADLADHNGAREDSQAQKLLKAALWS
jgi:excisionase family DNA binding protein